MSQPTHTLDPTDSGVVPGWSPGADYVEVMAGGLWAHREGDRFVVVAVHTSLDTGTPVLLTGVVSAAVLLGDHGLAGSSAEVEWLVQTGAVEQQWLAVDHPVLRCWRGFGIRPQAWQLLGLDPVTVRFAELAAHTATAAGIADIEPPF